MRMKIRKNLFFPQNRNQLNTDVYGLMMHLCAI